MFEVDGIYANRIGRYTVLEVNPPKMRVRYDDGSEAELRISVQERIWENIEADFQRQEASRSARAARKKVVGVDNKYYIKVVSVPAGDDLSFAGWSERVVMASLSDSDPKLLPGDRLIFFVLESKTFVAVATITGEPKTADPKTYFFKVAPEQMDFFPIDVDASVAKLDKGAPVDGSELESQPNFRRLRPMPESLLEINEDDFELLAELLTEVQEDDEEEEEEDDDLYEDDDED